MKALPSFYRSLAASLMGCALAVAPAQGQAASGISVGFTPTVERVFFDSDLLFDKATYFGGRLGLNFGRHVGVQAYYLTVDALSADSIGPFDSYRAGGDVVLTLMERKFTPFLRFGTGIMTFDRDEKEELLTATLGGGLRFDILSNLQTQLFVQDLIFRASDQSVFVDPAVADTIPAVRTFHNLTVGAGVNLYVGGEPSRTETDEFFERGLRGVTIPVEAFAGEFRFSDDFGLPDETVVGARLGLEFGPFVGLHGYYFGGTGNDFNDFDDFYGYGLEGSFNLTPPNNSLTPFLLLGSGRLHFTPEQTLAAGFTDDRKWTATLGGGVAVNLDDRVKLQASARNVLMSRDDPTDVTNPNQLKSSWLLSGGLEVALGGSRGRRTGRAPGSAYEPPPVEPTPEPTAEAAPAEASRARPVEEEPTGPVSVAPTGTDVELGEGETQAVPEITPTAGIDAVSPAVEPALQAAPAGEDSSEFRAMRDRIAALEAELQAMRSGRDRPSQERAADRLMQIPAPERGELYVRWGEPGAFDRARVGEPLREPAPAETPAPEAAATPDAVQEPEAGMAAAGVAAVTEEPPSVLPSPEYDALLASLAGITDRLNAIEASQARADSARMAQALADIESRMRELETPLTPAPTVIVPPAEQPAGGDVIIVDAAPRRGVFRGNGFEFTSVGVHTGASLTDPEQLLLGFRADIGSAFGGSARFVPEATFGVTGDGTFNLNTHIEWPLPVSFEQFTPFVGGGIGILAGRENPQGDSDLEFLIPNFTFGVARPLSRFEVYGAFHALDLFDDNRLLVGLRTRPKARDRDARPTDQGVPEAALLTTERTPPLEADPAVPEAGVPELSPEEEAERARLEAERARLEAELTEVEEMIRRQREVLTAEASEAERRRAEEAQLREEAAERARLETMRRELMARFSTLRIDTRSVSDVRQGDRGLVVELGGPGVFASGQSNLSGEAQGDVQQLAVVLVDYPDLVVSVEGHTDSTGGDEQNRELSRRRAETVRRALEAYGVEAARLSVVGHGEALPIASNATPAGRSRNRRVDVIVLGLRSS